MAARHFKYAYNAHIPPKTVFSKMILVNEPLINSIDLASEKNRIYFSRRKQLKNLMKLINTYIDFNSQTYFLMLYYMDIIFTHKDLEKIFYSHFTLWYPYSISNELQMNIYVLLSLACLVVASKFNENDPMVPSMSSYIRLLYEFSKKKYIFSLDSLFLAEIVVLKILKYKLNYYTIYHYLIFFFTHGIVLKKTIERSKIYKKISERKILEKVYIKVREIFDEIIESEKFYRYYCGKNNYEIVVEILLWCTEHILDEEIKDEENIFKLIYDINIESNKKKEMYYIIEQIHAKIKKRNALSNSSRLIELNKSKNINNVNNNLLNPKTNILSSRIPSDLSQYNNVNNYLHNIKQKSRLTSSTVYTDQTSYDQFSFPIQKNANNDYFKYVNSNIKNESLYSNDININKYIQNYNFPAHAPYNNNNIKNTHLNKTTNINYGPNKRIYLTINKNKETNSKFNVNSLEKMDKKNKSDDILNKNINFNINKRYSSSKKDKILPFEIEKEPIDNKKLINDKTGKIILINNNSNNNNNESNLRKKSLSCSKDNTNNYNYYSRSNFNNNSNNQNKKSLLDEKIKGTKIDSTSRSKEFNNFVYKGNEQNEQKDRIEKPLIKKEIILRSNKRQISEYKKYLLTKNILQKQSLNGSSLNNLNTSQKIIKDNIVNRTRYLDSINNNINNNLKKFNVTLELEPQDNYRRRSVNKYYIDSGNKNIINQDKNYKKANANTIIINNNIQINTLIDDKSRNLYFVNKNEVNDETKYNNENKYRNNKNKMNIKTEYKNIRKIYE